jgi:gliding motility-associated-like protein
MTATCDGGTASISGTTGGTFSFTTPPSDGASIDGSTGTVSGGSPSTLYNITYTTNGTCFSSSNTSVTSKPILTPTIICGATDKNSITFDWTIPSGATDFNVAYSVNGGSSVNIGSTTSNSYTVTGLSINSQVEITINTNGSECYDAATQICVSDDCTPSVANFSFEPTTVTSLDPVCEFTNLSENSIGYIWDFGDENSSTDENPSNEYIIGGEGKYNVILIAINEDGCNDTIIKKVSVKEEIIYYVPNAFTPDGDKFNNEFKPVFYSGIDLQSYTMLIFNRYGQLVFETHDVDKGWKGFYGESDVMSQDGVYTYKIDFKHTLEDDVEIITGTVLLMR